MKTTRTTIQLPTEAQLSLQEGNLIGAIKHTRAITGMGLHVAPGLVMRSPAPQTCPLCNAANNCARTTGAAESLDCWCRHVTIPAAVLAATGNADSCICSACAAEATRASPR